MSPWQHTPWCIRVEPLAGESFSHFLGRFRRANALSHQTLADELSRSGLQCLPSLIQAWESPSRRCPPTEGQLQVLSELMQLEVSQLKVLLFPSNVEFEMSTRLCSDCYGQSPIHRLSWQRVEMRECAEHHCLLLSACPVCQTSFRLPSLWEEGRCEWCWLPFEAMGNYASLKMS